MDATTGLETIKHQIGNLIKNFQNRTKIEKVDFWCVVPLVPLCLFSMSGLRPWITFFGFPLESLKRREVSDIWLKIH